MLAFSWNNREMRYFICSGLNMLVGLPNIRSRPRQENEEPSTEAENLTLMIDQPNICDLYYGCCDMVNRNNHCR